MSFFLLFAAFLIANCFLAILPTHYHHIFCCFCITPKDLSFHSDQGSNYTAYEFRELLRLFKINQSFSKAGNPYDNACMESFFSNLKREECNTKEYTSFDELQESMFSYIDYYNDYGPHQTLNNKAHNDIEKDFFVKNGNKKTTDLS